MIARDFRIPEKIRIEEGPEKYYARFVLEPFERGYGVTMGNSLRRVLLASLEGAAVTAIRIEGAQHEFSAIPGIKEDVTDIVLNFKKVHIRLNRDEPLIFTFTYKGEGIITAGDVFGGTEVECFNPELPIMTATTKTASLSMDIKVDRNRGYLTAETFEQHHAPLGTVYLDANFSPVLKVNYLIENARVGQMTDYDRLILDVWTNGSITPEAAVQEAAQLLIRHFDILVVQNKDTSDTGALSQSEDSKLMRMLSRPVEELELSVRAANCLKAANIRTIGELVVRSEIQMLQFPNFGKKSLDEIKALLQSMGLYLGMNVPGFTVEPLIIDSSVIIDVEDEEEEDE